MTYGPCSRRHRTAVAVLLDDRRCSARPASGPPPAELTSQQYLEHLDSQERDQEPEALPR